MELSHAGLAKSTAACYKRTWNHFNTFAQTLDLSSEHTALPLSQNIVAMFAAYLYHNNFAPTSIRSHLSAIAYSHNIQNFKNPVDSFLVNKMVKGMSVKNNKCDSRYPITLPILHSLLDIICHVVSNNYERRLFPAMFATAFYAFLRCGELCASPHNIQSGQISIPYDKSHVTVQIVHFKHSSPDRQFSIKINAKADKAHCPVNLLLAYLELRGKSPGPLFCFPGGSPVKRQQFSKQLQTCLAVLKLPAANYKLHSFRIGAATWALLQGKTEAEIQVLGRWSSTAFKNYLRVAQLNSIWRNE